MKKLIRLTEGQLHEMITESVSQILSELDWKTYLNYANKRYMQNLKKSGDRGYDKATKAFMDKYLPKGHQGRQYTDSHEYKIEPSFTRDTGYLDMSMKNNERTIPTT